MCKFGYYLHTMKNLSIKRILGFFIILILFKSCSKQKEMRLNIDKKNISNIEKLSSPNKQYDAYIYSIESGMAFGSSISAIKIVKYNSNPNFNDSDFLRVSNSRPFKIEWNNNNLIINTISLNENAVREQPFRTEIVNYKGISIKNKNFTLFSTMAMTEFRFSNFHEKNGIITFKNESDSLVFNNENSQISIGSNYLEINHFKKNKFDNNKGLAFDTYKLIPENNFDFSKLDKFQPLKIIEK